MQKEKAIKKYLFGIVFTRRACRTSHRGAEVFISITTLKNQSIDNEISRKMPCYSLIYRFNSSHGTSHSPNL
ncbi:hypothetical protein HMPREF1989_01519, partial [Porphyromonas gingivalis F0566]